MFVKILKESQPFSRFTEGISRGDGVATVSRIDKIIGLHAEYRLFYRALLQKRPKILSILLTKATPGAGFIKVIKISPKSQLFSDCIKGIVLSSKPTFEKNNLEIS